MFTMWLARVVRHQWKQLELLFTQVIQPLSFYTTFIFVRPAPGLCQQLLKKRALWAYYDAVFSIISRR